MKERNTERSYGMKCMLIIFLCFFMTSTGYIAWLYDLMALSWEGFPDLISMGAGYLLQAAGIFLFSLYIGKRGDIRRPLAIFLLPAYLICMIPSYITGSLALAVTFGFLSNLICGMIAGYYLYLLSKADIKNRAKIFGIAYGASTILSWILSLAAKNSIYSSFITALICIICSAPVILIERSIRNCNDDAVSERKDERPAGTKWMIPVASLIVALFSIVEHICFSFPSSDIKGTVHLELTRLFYGAGLVIAGLISDRNRKHGAVITLGALVLPFITLTLKNGAVPAGIVWSLSYFATAFFSVYRVILFCDLADRKKDCRISGYGLMAGRIGQSAGTVLSFALSHSVMAMAAAGAVLYCVAVFAFFWLYQKIYMPDADRRMSEEEHFQRFALKHDLSQREREIMRLLLQKETTPMIADRLFVSESTVKFHVHNILQKTGCSSRKELYEHFEQDRSGS